MDLPDGFTLIGLDSMVERVSENMWYSSRLVAFEGQPFFRLALNRLRNARVQGVGLVPPCCALEQGELKDDRGLALRNTVVICSSCETRYEFSNPTVFFEDFGHLPRRATYEDWTREVLGLDPLTATLLSHDLLAWTDFHLTAFNKNMDSVLGL